mgnify:CR=1 FL=1
MGETTSERNYGGVCAARGRNRRRGFLSGYSVDGAGFRVKVPRVCREVGVLLEPAGVVEKGVDQAYDI